MYGKIVALFGWCGNKKITEEESQYKVKTLRKSG
jgi:hypothetical protein